MTPLALSTCTIALACNSEKRFVRREADLGRHRVRDEALCHRGGSTPSERSQSRSLGNRAPPTPRHRILRPSADFIELAQIAVSRRSSKQKRSRRTAFNFLIFLRNSGAGEGIRTLDPNLGKVVLYP
jgi:hypothetical protein